MCVFQFGLIFVNNFIGIKLVEFKFIVLTLNDGKLLMVKDGKESGAIWWMKNEILMADPLIIISPDN